MSGVTLYLCCLCLHQNFLVCNGPRCPCGNSDVSSVCLVLTTMCQSITRTLHGTVPTIEQSHQIQHQAYHPIAQQTNLTELHLGASVNHDDPECLWYSLEMTLKCTLDELVGLKELCTLSLHYMNHQVRRKELDWIVKNLPNLFKICGFYPQGENLPKDIEQWMDTEPKDSLFHLRMLSRCFFFSIAHFSFTPFAPLLSSQMKNTLLLIRNHFTKWPPSPLICLCQ